MISAIRLRAGTDQVGSSLTVTDIEIGNLTQDDIQQLLMDLLDSTDVSRLDTLASICHQKTSGNAFFLLQYLELLHSKNLLEYNFALGGWLWNDDRIKDETNATDNVVDLMERKMMQLPTDTLQVLQIAACLGSSFRQESLYTVWQALHDSSLPPQCSSFFNSISTAVEEGFLEQKGDHKAYQWVHDSILEAAIASISPVELNELKFEIGSVLVRQLGQNRREIMRAVNLLNDGMSHSTLDEEAKVELARFNLMAAENSANLSAFDSASNYVTIGVSLLPDRCWMNHPHLALELHSLGAEVKGCLGKIDEMEHHCNLVIKQDLPLLDKLRVYHVLLDSTADRPKLEEAIKLCLQVLKDLGCTFPRRACSVNVLTILGVLRLQAKAKSAIPEERVGKLAAMKDRRRIEIMRFLDKLATYCYISENLLFAITILRRLSYTLKYGICDSSPIDFAGFGMILTGKLFDFQSGSMYAQYSLQLLEKLNSKFIHSRTLMVSYGFVLAWTQPTRSCLKHLLLAYEVGM
jgi:predicted ATPase